MSFAQWLGIRWEGLVQAIVIPLLATAVLFTGSLLANALRLLNVSKQFHSNGLWFAVKNSALYYSITRDRLPSLRTYVLVGVDVMRKEKLGRGDTDTLAGCRVR